MHCTAGEEDDDGFDVSVYFTYKSIYMLRFFSILQDISLHLKQGEYTLSKDIDVALYGEVPLREMCGGDFVIVDEGLNAQWFKAIGDQDIFKLL